MVFNQVLSLDGISNSSNTVGNLGVTFYLNMSFNVCIKQIYMTM